MHTRRRFLSLLAVFLAGFFVRRPAKASQRLRKWRCVNEDCEPYIYDPAKGAENVNDPDHPVPPGTRFEDLPADWVCPVCGDPKHLFQPLDEWVEVTA